MTGMVLNYLDSLREHGRDVADEIRDSSAVAEMKKSTAFYFQQVFFFYRQLGDPSYPAEKFTQRGLAALLAELGRTMGLQVPEADFQSRAVWLEWAGAEVNKLHHK